MTRRRSSTMIHETSVRGRSLKSRQRTGARRHLQDQSGLSWATPAGRRRRGTNRRRKITVIERVFRWIKVPIGVRRKARRR